MPRYFKFDYDFTSLDDLREGIDQAKGLPEEVLYVVGSYALSEVIKATPVRTGLLQSNWNPRGGSVEDYVRSKRLSIDGTGISIQFTNPTYYAGWVEFDHYSNGKLVPGRYYATKVLERLEQETGGLIQSTADQYLTKCFNGKRYTTFDRHLQYQ